MGAEYRKGHSLIELLVCIAIVGVLMSLYLPALSKAMRKAQEVAQAQGARQQGIGRMADTVNSTGSDPAVTRAQCRAAFRQRVTLQKDGEDLVSQLLFAVANDNEFAAYWNTLLNPAYSAPLQYDGNTLLAVHPNGTVYRLLPLSNDMTSSAIVGWIYISTDLKDTSSGTLGGNVLYGDSHVEYVRYPHAFPMTPTVAEYSHQFVLDFPS